MYIELYDPTQRTAITPDELGYTVGALAITKQENTAGSLQLTLQSKPRTILRPLAEHSIVAVYDDNRLLGDTVWPLRIDDTVVTRGGQSLLCTGVDLFDQFNTRYVIDQPRVNGNAATVMRDIFTKQFLQRDTYVTYEIDQSLAIEGIPNVTRDVVNQKVADALNDIVADVAKQTNIDLLFDLVQPAPDVTPRFRIWRDVRGVDRRANGVNPLLLTLGVNVAQFTRKRDYSIDINTVHAFGEINTGIQIRARVSRPTQGRYSYREELVSGSSAKNTVMLQQQANAALQPSKTTYEIVLIETPGMRWNSDIGYGDLVSALIDDTVYDCRISGFTLRYTNTVRNVEIRAVVL
jgi:hypothetical protein